MSLFTIDRTINFDEQKVRNVIEIIDSSSSVEEIENKMVAQKIVSLRDDTEPHGFFRRRWATFLKEFGIYDGQNLTEMAKLYAEKELTSKEFILLFLINRVVEHNGSLVRPLEVLLKITFEMKKRNVDFVIYEDEMKYIINRSDVSLEGIKNCVDTILNNRNNHVEYNTDESISPCHYDIWKNLLNTAGLNSVNLNEIKINIDLPIVSRIYDYYNSTPPNNEGNYKFDSKFVNSIELPKKANENEKILLKRKNYQSYYSEIIYNYLFEMSINNIEQKILNVNENGNIPYQILNGFNISTNRNDTPSNMRIYSAFKGYEGIIINKLRKTGDTIYSFIGSCIKSYIDAAFNEEPSNIEWIIPANPSIYNHIGALNKNGLIDWHQNRNFNVGDLVFLYGTVPYQKIIAVTRVERVNISQDEMVDDKEFWLTQTVNNNENSKYVRLRKVKILDDERLSLSNLLKHGLTGVPYGGKIVNRELSDYIHSIIDKNDIDEDGENLMNSDVISIDSERLLGGYNKIVYGIPGCGKSFHVAHTIIDEDDKRGKVFRTTFYLDYTNGDFVGQIIPKLNVKDEASVLYDIQSGPFTDALLDAILNPDKHTYLIIEEINRGNAAAIFGDIFQLLDRSDDTDAYYINNYIISTFLHKKIDNKYSVDYDLDNIKLPSNLILIGTMNTSDQNVFTLDTAFKRRWKMEYIKNDIFKSKFASETVPMSDVTWANFVNEINNYITSENGLGINGEDKQIGAYFISSSEWKDIKTTTDSKEAARIFAEKILSYIWDDVAKINRDAWFDIDKYKTLDSLVSSYTEKGLEVFCDNISFTREKQDKD